MPPGGVDRALDPPLTLQHAQPASFRGRHDRAALGTRRKPLPDQSCASPPADGGLGHYGPSWRHATAATVVDLATPGTSPRHHVQMFSCKTASEPRRAGSWLGRHDPDRRAAALDITGPNNHANGAPSNGGFCNGRPPPVWSSTNGYAVKPGLRSAHHPSSNHRFDGIEPLLVASASTRWEGGSVEPGWQAAESSPRLEREERPAVVLQHVV